jgi:hypothetical protein
MAAWIADSGDEHIARLGMQAPEPAAWRLVAAVLYAARIYE